MSFIATDEAPAVDQSALAVRKNLSQVESALSEFDKVSAGLADIAARFPVDLVYDVATTKGMNEAIAHRAAWRDPRLTVEKVRKMAKAPVLALGKDIDTRAAWLTDQLLTGEVPIDEQIKAEERRKEKIKQDKINAEFARVAEIQDAIAELHMDAMAVVGKASSVIGGALEAMKARTLDPLVFQEQIAQATAARQAAIDKLELAYAAALHTEEQARKAAAERAELEQLRAAAAEQRRKDDAAAAAQRQEQSRIEAEQRAERARLAEQQADLARKQAAFEDAQRKAAEPPPAAPQPVAVAQVAEAANEAPGVAESNGREAVAFAEWHQGRYRGPQLKIAEAAWMARAALA